jgi:hypothetical protein
MEFPDYTHITTNPYGFEPVLLVYSEHLHPVINENAEQLVHRYLNKSLVILLVIWALCRIGCLGLEVQFQEDSLGDIY